MIACSLFVIGPGANAEDVPPASEVVLLDQDYTALGAVPGNVVLANNLEATISASLGFNGAAGAIEYRTAGTQKGSVFVGIEPFVNGNLSISLKVSSDYWGSGLYITGSTFQVYTQTLADGRARVYSQYYTSPSQVAYSSYDVPVSALVNGVNTINIEVSGTGKSVRVYHDSTRSVTTPMHPWNVQNLPYDPLTLPMVRFTNEKSSRATWISSFLYGVRETVSGGPVTPVPGDDLVPFGIDVPRAEGNQNGAAYMAERGHVGVVWADEYYLDNLPEVIPFQQALLDQGWELGIHYSRSLNTLSTVEALAYMEEVYDQVYQTFGRAPTTWCSFENKDNLTHARYAYESLGMLWRNAQWYIPNGGSLVENTWPAFWSMISGAQMVTPSFTHFTDQTGTVSAYAIGYSHFTNWVDNYAGKSIVGFNEYYHRISNQVDTKIQYQSYTPGEELKFTVQCNEFPSRLLINFSGAGDAVVKKNGAVLTSPGDYQVVGDDRIVLLGQSGDRFEITSSGAPDVPSAPTLRGTPGNAQATLSWDPPSTAGPGDLTYHLFRDNASVWSGSATNYTDTGLTNGRSYSYAVAANNSVGWGPNSTAVTIVPASTPGAPLNLTATSGNKLVDLSWSPPSSNGGSNITGYNIYRGTAPGEGTLLATVGDVNNYTDPELTNGMTYHYTVSAVNAVGEGVRSVEVSATPAAVPSAPQGLLATSGDAQVNLTWSAPLDDGGNAITGYKVYRGTAAGAGTLLATLGSGLFYTDGEVINGQTYYYSVSAVTAIGEGARTEELPATPAAAATVPSSPQSLVAVEGNAQVTLTWAAPSSNGGSAITNYTIFRGTAPGEGTLLVTTGDVLTYTDAGVTNGQTYYYAVCAINNIGAGPRSAEASATPVAPSSNDFDYILINSGTAVEITGYHGANNAMVIPSSIEGKPVTSIGVRAFNQNVSLTSATIPGTVLSIGTYAFLGCSALTSVTMYDGVTSIGERAFYQCTALSSVIMPGSVRTIGGYAFYSCINLRSITIPEGVTSVGDGAFSGCSALTQVTVPASATYIGGYAFEGCAGLTSVTLAGGTTYIGARAFYQDAALVSVTVLGNVTSIGDAAFAYCSGLTSMTISGDVRSVGNYSFYGCSRLGSMVMTGTTYIGARAFYQDAALVSVTVLGNVTSIGDAAFAYCSGLTSMTISGDVRSVGNYSFYGCSRLGSMVMTGTTYIGTKAFQQCTALTSVTIPGSVVSIGSYAFTQCTSLVSINMANGVVSLGDGAFSYCSALAAVTIPASVTYIGNYTFYQCTSLTQMIFEGNAPVCGGHWIDGHNASLKAYYFEGATGFTTPTWQGITTVSQPRP
jgi:fibronectin type 3 domain-containing protein